MDTAIGALMFEWDWLGVDSRFRVKKTYIKRDWIKCSKYVNRFRFYNQYDWGGGLI